MWEGEGERGGEDGGVVDCEESFVDIKILLQPTKILPKFQRNKKDQKALLLTPPRHLPPPKNRLILLPTRSLFRPPPQKTTEKIGRKKQN